jgi:isochorismate synthase
MPNNSSVYRQDAEWNHLWKEAQQHDAAIAIWRLPNSDTRSLLIDTHGGNLTDSLDLPTFEPGFMAAPFVGNPYYFKAEYLFVSDVPIVQVTVKEVFPFKAGSPEKENFLYWVNASIQEIKAGNFQKVVLSRTDEEALEANYSTLHFFESLCQVYPQAFVSAFYIPSLQQTWICATPEVLVSLNREGIFKTISLAGTQSILTKDGQMINPQDARWSQKEIEEQAFVSRYIIECFKKIRLREYVENGPKTIQAGNLLHLKTEYIVDTQALNFSQLPGIMLSLLHPTSAVCGTPKEAAIDWIKQAETYNREFYSGYLGPVNLNDEIYLYVNLRTVKITKDTNGYLATYYAGCGITEDSDPEKEWEETEMKCQTLQRILSINQ